MKESTCIDSSVSISEELRRKFSDNGINQSKIALETGVNQSQVSRILSGKFKKRSKNVDILCIYANIKILKNKVDPIQSKVLIDALSFTWNGTDSHAKALAKIITAIGGINS